MADIYDIEVEVLLDDVAVPGFPVRAEYQDVELDAKTYTATTSYVVSGLGGSRMMLYFMPAAGTLRLGGATTFSEWPVAAGSLALVMNMRMNQLMPLAYKTTTGSAVVRFLGFTYHI